MKIRFARAAEQDVLDAIAWYAVRSTDAVARFRFAVIAAVEAAAASPEQARMDAEGFRFRNLRGFPFVIAYRLLQDDLVVLAVAHHRRKPGLWRDRAPPRSIQSTD